MLLKNAIKSTIQPLFCSSGFFVETPQSEVSFVLAAPPFAKHTRHLIHVHILYLCSGLARLQQLFDAIAQLDFNLEVKVYRVMDAKDAYDTIKTLDSGHKEGDNRIILDLPTTTCEKLLKQQVWNIIQYYDIIHVMIIVNT